MTPAGVLMGALGWVGRRSAYVLFIGCGVALMFPALASFLRPALPGLVALVLGAAAARIDLIGAARDIARPRVALTLVATLVLLTPVAAILLIEAARPFGTDVMLMVAAFAAAPPIASAASLCFLLGFDAKRALQLTLLATMTTPLIGPPLIAYAGVAGLETGAVAVKLFAIIAAGLAIGAAARAMLGARRMAALGPELDGASALIMVLFVIPLFDGAGAAIMATPWLAAGLFGFAVLLNFGANAAANLATRRVAGRAGAGALGVVAGNRNVSLYLATLPPDPVFGLFVALYQFPMYATPLVGRWLGGPR